MSIANLGDFQQSDNVVNITEGFIDENRAGTSQPWGATISSTGVSGVLTVTGIPSASVPASSTSGANFTFSNPTIKPESIIIFGTRSTTANGQKCHVNLNSATDGSAECIILNPTFIAITGTTFTLIFSYLII